MRAVCPMRPQPHVSPTRRPRAAPTRTASHAPASASSSPIASSEGDIDAPPPGGSKSGPAVSAGATRGSPAWPARSPPSTGSTNAAPSPSSAHSAASTTIATRMVTGASWAARASSERGSARNVMPKAFTNAAAASPAVSASAPTASVITGATSGAPLVAPVMTLAVGALALTAGLAAAAFVKAFGITFLALPRSDEARAAHEAPVTMRVAMVVLAALCALLGLGAAFVLPVLGGLLAGHAGLPRVAPALTAGPLLLPPGGGASMSPSLLAIGLLLALAGAWLAVRVGAARGLRVGDTWGCGRIGQTARMEYTSTAYAEPLRRVFAELYRPTEDLTIDVHPESRYFVQSRTYRSEIVPWFERYVYAPLVRWVAAGAAHTRAIQSGSAHAYLAYLVVALLALLAI